MYLRDLEEGLLIKPVDNYRWQLSKLSAGNIHSHYSHEDGAKELNENGIHHHVSPIYKHRWKTSKNEIAVYLGVKVIKNHYYGVKKQHMLLIDGTVAVVDGYQVRYIEKV